MRAERLPDVAFFKLDNIPSELKEQARWVCWRWCHNADGKLQKLPTDPGSGRNINDKDLARWMSFAEARGHAEARAYEIAGVGFCMTTARGPCGRLAMVTCAAHP